MTTLFRSVFSEDGFRKLMDGSGAEGGLSNEFPFYPLNSPGMPLPGPNFKREAAAMTGDFSAGLPADFADLGPRDQKKAIAAAQGASINYYLTYLYYRALYDDEFSLSVEFKGRYRPVRYIPGHLWGYEADGPRSAQVMVVGKNPGRDEEDAKRNFVGPTSIYFREQLERLGFKDLGDWYVTNIVRFANFNPASDKLPKAWVNDDLPLLHQEIRLVRPTHMLLLGSEAIAAVLGEGQKFKNTNGKVHRLEFPVHEHGEEEQFHVVNAVTCVHPASVAHEPKHEDDLVKALLYFRDSLGGSSSTLDPEASREHIVCQSAEHLQQLVNRLQSEGRTEFAIDTEFDGDTPKEGWVATVQFSWEEKKAIVLNLRDEQGQPCFEGGIEAGMRLLTSLMKGKDKRIIGHYFNADLWWLKSLGLEFLEEQFYAPKDDPDPDGVERLFGWQKTATEGGFDTMLAAHAHEETADFGLKELVLRHTSIPNYETELDKWKRAEAKRLKCGLKELPGFGACPREILLPYALYDSDGTFRLYRLYNRVGGLLDKDRFGNCCRIPFWLSMRAALAFYEMHETGMLIDLQRAEEMMSVYRMALDRLVEDLRASANWSDLNPNSPLQCKELLFGVEYNGKINKVTGENQAVHPPGARLLNLWPYKSTGKRSKLWEQIRASGKEHEYTPAVDKETLTVYSEIDPVISMLRDTRFIGQILRTVLRPPKESEEGEAVLDDNGEKIYERGLLSFLQPDKRVHTNLSQVKETRRSSSWRPALQNISKRREPDYKRILGPLYSHPLRSMFVAPPGWVTVSADYTGAELMLMAVQAGDENMIDHCERANLPDSGFDLEGNPCSHGPECRACVYPHPRYYCIHANVAVGTFKPKDPETQLPLRSGRLARHDLVRCKLKHLREAAKPVDFGYAYGMTGEAAYRKAREGGADVTRQDSDALIAGLEQSYPGLPVYFNAAAARSVEPGWICNCFGGFRRTYFTSDKKAQGEIERQFKNFPIQSAVADAVSIAMANIREYREAHNMRFRLALQIHDDIISLVPIDELEQYYDEVVPKCMTEMVDIWPCDFDGQVKEDPRAPYHLVPGRNVYLRWGVPITPEEAEAQGIPLRFAGAVD